MLASAEATSDRLCSKGMPAAAYITGQACRNMEDPVQGLSPKRNRIVEYFLSSYHVQVAGFAVVRVIVCEICLNL